MPGETLRDSTRDVQRLGSTLKLIATRRFLAGCRLRHSVLASSSSKTCGSVAPKFILGSDSLRARSPKRRNSGSDICRKRSRSSSGLSGLSSIKAGLPCCHLGEETGRQNNTTTLTSPHLSEPSKFFVRNDSVLLGRQLYFCREVFARNYHSPGICQYQNN